MDVGLSSVNATGKSKSVFPLSTGAESLNGTRAESLNGDWLASSHGILEVATERVRETKAYSNHIKNLNLELEKFLGGKIFRLKIFH